MNLLFRNLRWIDNGREISADIRIGNGIIKEIGNKLLALKVEQVVDFTNHFLYPGLINAHDHLEMNLYSKLGTPPYDNYVGWAKDIYKPGESPIKEIERVDIKDRLMWGGIKNLISGVNTVAHHNPWHRLLGKDKFPVKVIKKTSWAHSLAFGKELHKSFPKKNDIPFVIHAAEGIDDLAYAEISKLKEMGLLKSNTVLIHALALSSQDIETIANENASVVWCPASNLYMFNQTAPIQKLKDRVRIALGSDSTLTGSATFLDEIRVAHNTGNASSEEIFDMATNSAADMFNIPTPAIKESRQADLFITPIKHQNYLDNLMHVKPADVALVLIDGEVRLLDADVALKPLKYTMKVESKLKHFDIDIESLMKRIQKNVGSSILEANTLWNMIRR